MKQKIFLLLILGTITFCRAQQVSYKEIEDDPLAYKKLSINLHWFNVDFAKPGVYRVGAGVELDLNKRLWIMADVDKGVMFADLHQATKQDYLAAETGIVFNFRTKMRTGEILYKWKEPGYENKLRLKGKVLRTTGLRGGITSFTSPKEIGSYAVQFSAQGIYAGIVFGATRNKTVSAEGIDLRHTRKATKGIFYIDAMYSPLITCSDITNYEYTKNTAAPAKESVGKGKLDSLVTKNMLGVRMGWMKMVRYPIPVKFGFEVGMRPGIQQNFFFLSKLAFSLGFIHSASKE